MTSPQFCIVKRNGKYRVLRLDGYTAGRPSYRSEPLRFYSRTAAEDWIRNKTQKGR